MISTEEEYRTTQDTLAEFRRTLAALEAHQYRDPWRARLERHAAASQIETFERDLAMWEAGIREPVPEMPQPADLDLPLDATLQQGMLALKRAEIANIDRQIGILLDRIADWRRHRAWLEREIAELEAQTRAPEPAQTKR